MELNTLMELHIQLLHPEAKAPHYAHSDDAGMDLFAVEDMEIATGERAIVPTGVAMAIPDGHVGLVWDKSGIATKTGLTTIAGVIDAGYRGEIKIAVLNTGAEPYVVRAGEKIAQMLIQPVHQPTVTVVESLEETARGEGGFGSTGLT